MATFSKCEEEATSGANSAVTCLLLSVEPLAPPGDRDRDFVLAGADEGPDFEAGVSERTRGNVVGSTTSIGSTLIADKFTRPTLKPWS